jgi:predicted DNA-binding protein (MmcQ/YjbR family)
MDFDIEKVSGIGEYAKKNLLEDGEKKGIVFQAPNERAFAVWHFGKTLEVRTDSNLAKLLTEKYETVMQSRYFGRGGIEVVLSGQIPEEEIYDLVRLSYNLTVE